MVSFGYNTGDGTGSNVALMSSNNQVQLTPYINDTGGYVFVTDIDLLNSTKILATGDYQAVLYELDWFTGQATNLIAASDLRHDIQLGTNNFVFTGWGADIIIHPDQQVGVGIFMQNAPSLPIFGNIRCDGGETPQWFKSKRYMTKVGVTVLPDPFPFPEAGWLNGILPMRVNGIDTGTLPSTVIQAPMAAMDSLLEGYSNIRAAIVANECLTPLDPEPYMSTEVFPELSGLAFNVKKAPEFHTRVAQGINGHQVRNSFMQFPLWNFELTYDYLPDRTAGNTDLKTLMGFFLKMRGRWDTFLFRDPDDYTTTLSPVATGDGVTTSFYFVRDLGGFSEPVGQVNTDETYEVYVDGVLQVEGVDYDLIMPNRMLFVTAPGDGLEITNTLQYYFVCTFVEDTQEYDKFMDKLWELQTCSFKSVATP